MRVLKGGDDRLEPYCYYCYFFYVYIIYMYISKVFLKLVNFCILIYEFKRWKELE